MADITRDIFSKGTVLTLKGQFTGGDETDRLEELMNEVCNSENPNLIVDASGVTFLGSIAIGKIVKLHSEFNEKEGKVVYCGFNNVIINVLKSTKIWNIIIVADDVDLAEAKFD